MAAAGYDPGTPTTDTIRPLGPNQWTIDSFRGEAKSYIVTLGEKPCCDCPHFCNRLAGSGQACKHIVTVKEHVEKQERAAKYHELTLKAGSLTDDELVRLIEKYRPTPGPVLLALLAEQFDREALEVVTETPAETPVPALEAVLERARHWGQARREAAAAPVRIADLPEAERRAIWA